MIKRLRFLMTGLVALCQPGCGDSGAMVWPPGSVDGGASGGKDVDGPGISAADAAAGADGDGAGLAPPEVNISGRWAMFAFEDPVAIDVVQHGDTVNGTGCYAGLPTIQDRGLEQFCTKLQGTVAGRHVQLGFATTEAPYAADVYASADGQRMAGRFHNTGNWASAFAWLRIGVDDRWLPVQRATALEEVLSPRAGQFLLQPVGAAPAAIERPDSGYFLSLIIQGRGPQIGGTMGSFFTTELAWNDADQSLTAGPVPVSSPATPIKLVLRFAGLLPATCDATMPDGTVYTFMASLLSR